MESFFDTLFLLIFIFVLFVVLKGYHREKNKDRE